MNRSSSEPLSNRVPPCLAVLAAALLAANGSRAQGVAPVPPVPPHTPQEPHQPIDPRLPTDPRVPDESQVQLEPGVVRDPLDPMWVMPKPPPPFQGFPLFPSRLSTYGGYPPEAGEQAPGQQPLSPSLLGALLAPALPEPPGWPAWLRTRDKTPLPYGPDVALLVRNADRVWWRTADDEPLVPLFFHDKLRTLGVGSTVEVRQAGEFELLLHTSARLVARGPTVLRLVTLSETDVTIDVPRFTRLRLQALQREHTLLLPDGSKLVVPPAPASPVPGEGGDLTIAGAVNPFAALLGHVPIAGVSPFGAPDPTAEYGDVGPALVLLTRAEEPLWLGGRATIFNASGRDVIWRHAFGETKLGPGQRVTLFLQPSPDPIGADVQAQDTDVDRRPGALTGRSAAGGRLSWCGARFSLPPGAMLRLDAMQGQPFAEPAPAAKGAAARTP